MTLLFVGCYEDKGNYDYTLDTMNEITSVTFSPKISKGAGGSIIEVQQPLNEDDRTRRVEASVEQTIATNLDDLEFYWCRSYTDEEGKNIKDTLHTKGYLEIDFPVGKEMSYNIFLQVYDKTTTLSHYSSFKLSTRPLFKNSLFVLHGNEGERKIGNIEVIGEETKIYTDVKTATNDNNHYENATGFTYTTYINITEGGRTYETKSLTVYADNGETKVYDPNGMKVKYTSPQIFKPESENFSYKKTIQTGNATISDKWYKIVLTETGEVFFGNIVHALYKPGHGRGEGDTSHERDYEITAATITGSRFLMWDAKNNRFLYSAKEDEGFAIDEIASTKQSYVSTKKISDAYIDFTNIKSPADMTAIMGYINYRDNYDYQNAYFIFKDESTDKYYRYELSMQNTGDADGGDIKKAQANGEVVKIPAGKVESVKELIGFTPTDASTITYNSCFTTDNLFYAEGNTVYRYNATNGDKYVVYEAPQGYDVTMLKFATEDASSFTAELALHLNIVMYNGSNSAIAEIKFTTAADVDEDFTPLFYDRDNEGNLWGEIKDIQFVNELVYNNTNAE